MPETERDLNGKHAGKTQKRSCRYTIGMNNPQAAIMPDRKTKIMALRTKFSVNEYIELHQKAYGFKPHHNSIDHFINASLEENIEEWDFMTKQSKIPKS